MERPPDDAREASDATTAPAPAAASAGRRFGYTPALDGLRAFAITLVVLFHYPWANQYFRGNPVHGGFLGVDVFFVLSGFLITTLLLEEHDQSGRVSLGAFYARRALRLLPAFFVLFAIGVVEYFIAARPTRIGLLAMLGYMANWIQLWRNDPLGPLLSHTWSLAIEEQFYLVFPLIMLGLFRARLRRTTIALVLGAGALSSATWRMIVWNRHATQSSFVDFYAGVTARTLPATNPFRTWNRWYFGTDTRADALLVGCLAAVLLVQFRPKLTRRVTTTLAVVGVAAFAGTGVIVGNALILSSWLPNWGLFVLECCVALTVVGVVVAPRSPLTWVCALPPLVWIGRRSYAIYLFHQVVFNEVTRARTHAPPWLSFWIQIAIIGIIAEVSWRFIESPFLRRKGRFERRRTPSPLPASVQ